MALQYLQPLCPLQNLLNEHCSFFALHNKTISGVIVKVVISSGNPAVFMRSTLMSQLAAVARFPLLARIPVEFSGALTNLIKLDPSVLMSLGAILINDPNLCLLRHFGQSNDFKSVRGEELLSSNGTVPQYEIMVGSVLSGDTLTLKHF